MKQNLVYFENDGLVITSTAQHLLNAGFIKTIDIGNGLRKLTREDIFYNQSNVPTVKYSLNWLIENKLIKSEVCENGRTEFAFKQE